MTDDAGQTKAAKKIDPIKKITLADGRTRYRFVVDVGKKPDGKRDQRTYTYDTLKEARAERARTISERAQGTLIKPNKKLTVAVYLAEWLETKQGKKASTVRSYADALRPIVERHGALPLQALDAPHLEALKRDMLSGKLRRVGKAGTPLSARSVNLMLTVATMALKAAVKRRLISHNVGEIIDRVQGNAEVPSNRGDWQTSDAVAFLKAVRDDRLYAAWLLSLLGLRRGEVLGLRWSDVDLTGERAKARKFPEGTPTLTITQNRVAVAGEVIVGTPKAKGSKRTLPLPETVVATLKSLKARQAAEKLAAGEAYDNADGLVVVDELGQSYRPEWYSNRFVALGQLAGVPRVPLHGARHCAGSLLGDLGYPDVVVAAWLGHTQVTVTHGYQHAMNERMSAAGKALGDVLAG